MKEFTKTGELLGWYSTTSDMKPYEADVKIHKLFSKYCESQNAIYLCLDPKKTMKNAYEMIVKVYECKDK